MTVVVLTVSHLLTSRELQTSNSENKRLRDELGRLTVKDASQLGLLAIPTTESNTWRWRIYMPADVQLRMGITDAGIIPTPGAPIAGANVGYFDAPLPAGEGLVEAKLYKGGDDVWTVSVRTSDGTMTCELRNGDLSWLDGSAFFRTRIGSTESRTVDASKVVPLLRHVVVKHDSLTPSSPNPNPGIMIWLEPAE